MQTVRVPRTPKVEEFYNSNHSPSDGKFSGGRSGPVGGARAHMHMTDAQLKQSSRPEHKRELARRQAENKPVYLSAKISEFYNMKHSPKTGKFSWGTGGSHAPQERSKLSKSRSQQSAFNRSSRRTKGLFRFASVTEEFYNHSHDPHSGRFANGSGAHVPSNIRDPSHRAAYQIMKNREARQEKLAQTNRARANHGMKPIQN